MGAVWEGTHLSLGTRVAVKFIDAEYAESPEARSRFENEARAAARLRSKHVVEVYDHGVSDDGRPFIVMEFLQGEPLDKRLDRVGRLPANETAQILLQVCRALTKAHAANIVHRDLKPENVFLVWDDEEHADLVKVVDFGIAKFNDQSMNGSSATRTGSVLGTPYYMSPEQARGLRGVDSRSDLWSVAVIAYRCIVGSLPFEGEAVGDLLVKLCTAPIPVPSEIVTDVPPSFDAWFHKALSREPAQRFQTAAQLSESLAAVCGLPVRGLDAGSGPYSALGSGSFGAASAGVTFTSGVSAANSLAESLLTGAPTTQTPTPSKRGGSGARAALGLGALLVAGIAGALGMRSFAGPPAPAVGAPLVAASLPTPPPSASVSPATSATAAASAVAPDTQPAASPGLSASSSAAVVAKPLALPKVSRLVAKPTAKPVQKLQQKPNADIGF